MIDGWTPLTLLAALFSSFGAALVVRMIFPPPRRLETRVRPYIAPSLASLAKPTGTNAATAIFGPLVNDVADRVGRIIDRGGAPVTLTRLRQAGWFRDLAESEMLSAYRMVQLRSLGMAILVGGAIGQLIGASTLVRMSLIGLGIVIGVTRTRGRLTKATDQRRELMKVEVYTVNQLLAMRVRAGGGVIQAVKTTTQRGSGAVIDELSEALRLHRAGWAAPDAFRRIAELTPEPFCSRTYRLLASAEERGGDLGNALLSLSEDVRETRREAVKRTATKRRAAMLMPTIAILAPVLILFVAAPLPYLITSWQ